MPLKVLAKNNDRASGVLPINAATRAAAATKGPQPRLKLEVRRLPPGLTLTDFEEILGDEWKLGNGKVDWREYRQGKVKTALGKVPEQSRCYVHLVNEQLVKEFEARFLAATFQDKAGTYRNPDLKNLPPTIGFAPNQRTPLNAKPRADTRQGTIDQDPEFIAFLEAETQPISKAPALDSASAEPKDGQKVEVKSTPLIEALREKKANKAKAAESKAEKKESKGHSRDDSKDAAASKKDGKEDKATQQKVEQASKEAVKALNKQVASKQQQSNQRPASPQQPQAKNAAPTKSKKEPKQTPKQQNAAPSEPANTTKNAAANGAAAASQAPTSRGPRQRGNAEGIKKMLQKDLGIRPKPAPTAQDKTEKSSQPSSTSSPAPASSNTTNTKEQKEQSKSTPTGPASSTPAKVPTGPKQQQQTSTSSPSSFKAYLKHANPSQGMTEILIQQALSQYGDVASVTIDPRKGTAIAIFKDNETMKKAVEAKKVPVANGNVEVLEFKDRNAGNNRGGFRGGRGGARGGRGGGQAAGNAASQSQSPAPAKTESGPGS